MSSQSTSSLVPAEMAADVEEIVGVIQGVAQQQGQPWDNQIRIVRPQGRQMVPGALEGIFLVCSFGGGWFSKKWVDTFVWPEIEKRIRKPSQKAVEFVFSKIPPHPTDDSEKQ